MYRDSEEVNNYREYSKGSNEMDYANPGYYQTPETQSPRSTSSEQASGSATLPLEYAEYVAYADYTKAAKTDVYGPEGVKAYQGPASLEGYTADVGAEQREAADRGSAGGSKAKRVGWIGLIGILVAIGSWLLKFKTLATLGTFLLKFGMAGVTAVISIVVYAYILGWPFAIGLVALLFVHEMGHALVIKLKGIPIGSMIFIPMLGAMVTMQQMPKNAKDEAEVGIAGPIAGALASAVCLFIAQTGIDPSPIWAPLAYFGFLMNLFNLVPIVPFDGGRILAAVDKRIWFLGFLGLLAYQIWRWMSGDFSFWLLLIVIMAGMELWSRRGTGKTAAERAYYNVPVRTRIVISLLYFGLAAVLALGMSISHALVPLSR